MEWRDQDPSDSNWGRLEHLVLVSGKRPGMFTGKSDFDWDSYRAFLMGLLIGAGEEVLANFRAWSMERHGVERDAGLERIQQLMLEKDPALANKDLIVRVSKEVADFFRARAMGEINESDK